MTTATAMTTATLLFLFSMNVVYTPVWRGGVENCGRLTWSGYWELNPNLTHPKRVYCHCTIPRFSFSSSKPSSWLAYPSLTSFVRATGSRTQRLMHPMHACCRYTIARADTPAPVARMIPRFHPWWTVPELHRRPLECESSVLLTELTAQKVRGALFVECNTRSKYHESYLLTRISFSVLPARIELTLRVPETRVLSVERREDCPHFQKIVSETRKKTRRFLFMQRFATIDTSHP